jgi:hypothetical protein
MKEVAEGTKHSQEKRNIKQEDVLQSEGSN